MPKMYGALHCAAEGGKMSTPSNALVKLRDQIAGLPTAITIETPEHLKEAVEEVKKIKAYKKAVKAYWDPLCENGHKTWKALTTRRKEFIDPADKVEKAYKLGIGRFHEAERVQKEKEHRLRVQAEEKAAEEKRLAQMTEFEDMGELDQAAHIANQPLDVVPVAAPQETKAEGLSTSYRYSAEVVSFPDFLGFLAGEPRFQYLVKDFPMKELNKLATAQKEMFDIPGCKLVKKIIPSIRS